MHQDKDAECGVGESTGSRLGRGMKTEPKEMDGLFHRMAWSGIAMRADPGDRH